MSQNKIIIIGIDGATWDVLNPLMRKGYLPTIKSLVKNGSSCVLRSVIPPISSPAWKCLTTGKDPGQLGVYAFLKRIHNSYESVIVDAGVFSEKEIWDYLEVKNEKSLIFNIPITYPPKKINGWKITGFLTPQKKSSFCYPYSLKKEIRNISPDFSVVPQLNISKEDDIPNFLKNHINFLNNQMKVFKNLLEKKNWDFSMIVFRETDTFMHYFWKYIDPTHKLYSKQKAKRYAKYFYEYFKAIDNAVKKIIKKLKENDNIFIISDHGFGKAEKTFFINKWLEKENYIKTNKENKVIRLIKNIILKITNKLIVFNIVNKREMSIFLKRITKKTGIKPFHNINLDKSKAISFYSDMLGMINIHTEDFPKGKIKKSSNIYKILIKDIKNKMSKYFKNKNIKITFKDPRKIYKEHNQTPDIMFYLDNYRIIISENINGGKILANNDKNSRSGTHREEGIFIGMGKDIKKGLRLRNASLLDIAPTVLHMKNIPIPEDFAGKVMLDIFKESSKLKKRKIRRKKTDEKKKIREIINNINI